MSSSASAVAVADRAPAISRRVTGALALGVIAPLAIFGALAVAVSTGHGLGWDTAALRFAEHRYRAAIVDPLDLAVKLGAAMAALGASAAAVVNIAAGRWRRAAFCALAIAGVLALDGPLKHAFARPALGGHRGELSFPSGNAMLSAAALAAAVLMAKPGGRRNVLRYGVPLLIAYGAALVYAWWHYPTDVVAGWCVGVAWVMALWLVLSSARTSAGAPVGARPLRVLLVTSEWPSPEIPCTSPYTVQQVEFLRAAGLSVDVFAFRGARKPRNYLEAWRRLRPQLDPARYDLVHAQHGQAGLLPWPRRLPLVVTFHGTDILGDRRPDGRLTKGGRFLQWLCRLEALLADRVIIVSDAMREHLPASVTPVLLPSGVDVDSVPAHSQDEARRALGLPLSERLILFVGNPATIEKRYDLAERAVEVLAERLPARLVVGWNRSQREILVLMRACDVLVMTSRQEGSPTVVKEALACALPVVSVRVGDVAQRIAGVDGCELCSDDRPETVAAALERVLRRGRRLSGGLDPELDERVLTERLVALYRSVLTGSGRRW